MPRTCWSDKGTNFAFRKYNRHLNRQSRSVSKQHQCEFCHKMFAAAKSRDEHQRAKPPNLLVAAASTPKEIQTTFRETTPNQTKSKKRPLDEDIAAAATIHLTKKKKMQTTPPSTCDLCQATFAGVGLLARHWQTQHRATRSDKKEGFTCDRCHYSFYHFIAMRMHRPRCLGAQRRQESMTQCSVFIKKERRDDKEPTTSPSPNHSVICFPVVYIKKEIKQDGD